MASDGYWAKRAAQRQVEAETIADAELERLQANLAEAIKKITADIERIWGRFAESGGMSRAEAEAIMAEELDPGERERLTLQAASIEDPWDRARMMARVQAGAYRARINRLEATKLSAETRLAEIIAKQRQGMTRSIVEASIDRYNKTTYDIQSRVGLNYDFVHVTEDQALAAARVNWSGHHYSTRLWHNHEELAEKVRDVVEQNMLSGRSWYDQIDDMRQYLQEEGDWKIARLLRTEMAFATAQMNKRAYEEARIDEYTYIATLDMITSLICRSLDGKRFKVKNAQIGINFPPMHPHCRSTTGMVLSPEVMEGLERRARDPATGELYTVPTSMTYADWAERNNVAETVTENLPPDKLNYDAEIARLKRNVVRTLHEVEQAEQEGKLSPIIPIKSPVRGQGAEIWHSTVKAALSDIISEESQIDAVLGLLEDMQSLKAAALWLFNPKTGETARFGKAKDKKAAEILDDANKAGLIYLLLYNHRDNEPPTLDEVNALLDTPLHRGVVVTQSGQTYLYGAPKRKITTGDWEAAAERIGSDDPALIWQELARIGLLEIRRIDI